MGTPTGTTPTQCAAAGFGNLTYANFARSFFASYCVRCHATTVTGAARNGAPEDHNFDSYAGVQQFDQEIDQVAAMNPTGSQRNNAMPISEPFPTDRERQMLACWIALGIPQ